MKIERYKERYVKNIINKSVLDEQQRFAYGEMFQEFCKPFLKQIIKEVDTNIDRVPMMTYIDKLAPVYRQWVNKFLAKINITDEEIKKNIIDYLIHQVQPTIMKIMGVASK